MRTEEDKVLQKPLKVILGGQEKEIKILPIKHSKPWRKKFADEINGLAQGSVALTDNQSAISMLFVSMPDKVLDLFFAYAKDLNREEIEEVATDAELSAAFNKIVEYTFPLAKSLTVATARLSP